MIDAWPLADQAFVYIWVTYQHFNVAVGFAYPINSVPVNCFNLKTLAWVKKRILSNPRWVNFWSRYDLASYPVSFNYSNPAGVIKDIEIHSSKSPEKAHLGYWELDEMADHIARTF